MYNHTRHTERQWFRLNQHTWEIRARYFIWDNSSRLSIFLALDESSRHGAAVLACNLISSHGSTQNTFNCNGMAFHFLNVLYKNTYRSPNAAWLFLTRPYPHLQTEIEEYEERRKTGGYLKRKHQGYVLNSLRHATVSTAKRLGDCRVFTNTVDEVMVQGRKEAYLPTG